MRHRLVLSAALALLPASPAAAAPIARAGWVRDVAITEYYPVPEAWFDGRLVAAPGLEGLHRVDWLYSSRGVMMEGDGYGLDGRRYHLDAGYGEPWVNARGRITRPRVHGGGWTRGRPIWRASGWRAADGAVTYPRVLEDGSEAWSAGRAVRELPVSPSVLFAQGPSRPLRPYRSAAVDPRLIPLGTRIFIRAYCKTAGKGWLVAADTGGAITGRHIDVYRRPPASLADEGRYLPGQRIYVIPPGAPEPRRLPRC